MLPLNVRIAQARKISLAFIVPASLAGMHGVGTRDDVGLGFAGSAYVGPVGEQLAPLRPAEMIRPSNYASRDHRVKALRTGRVRALPRGPAAREKKKPLSPGRDRILGTNAIQNGFINRSISHASSITVYPPNYYIIHLIHILYINWYIAAELDIYCYFPFQMNIPHGILRYHK
ncbi:hypothetical protein SPHINGO391_480105 [Sphingomonas aurantiaca]|uniref:Uncharacterized protein n=1 Tax=Sphingomonas aurantiaca TaxID=185949 RepID=A0A5E8A502_9SPHN|nr:hypothetical protein SPHINGO391_480105 [Sphingomonas aurantiaca]